MKKFLKKLIVDNYPQKLKNWFYPEHEAQFKENIHFDFLNMSYSQEGEDLVLNRLLGKKENIFYVDVGAHHPFRFSNTYVFYRRGGSGINIDPLPESMALFKKYRKRDINLELGISDHSSILKYYQFEEPALNGFSEELSIQREKLGNSKLIGVKEIKTQRLDQVFQDILPAGQQIDFLSIDVEGHDLNVLQSSNWELYRPTYVLAEELSEIESNTLSVTDFMASIGYEVIAKTVNTLFFRNVED